MKILARVKRDGKYGFIDEFGKEKIPCIYDEIDSFEIMDSEI